MPDNLLTQDILTIFFFLKNINERQGLGHLPPSYLCPGGAWRGGGLLDTEVLHCPSVSPSAATAGVDGRGRVFALPLWACVLSVLGTGVVISWEHGPQAPSV